MKAKSIFPLLITWIFLSGCTSTFAGTLLVLGFRDLILYVALALIISVIAALITSGSKRTAFWICFILSLVLTPVAGLIYFLILVTKNQD